MADAEGEDAEDVAWNRLMVKLIALRGDEEVEALLRDKHKELIACAVPGDAAAGDGNAADAEARQSWFSRKLKHQNGDTRERRKLCKMLMKTLRKYSEKYEKPAENALSACEVLKEGKPQEGPIICHKLAAGLVGTRFEGLRIAKVRPGVYQLGEKLLVAVQADLEGGELLVHGYFDESHVLHPVRAPVRAFLEEHHGAKPPVDQGDMFGGAAPAEGSKVSKGEDQSPVKRHRELPPGWVKKESRSKPGTFYYVHEEKGLSQFVRPDS